ncbi:unnamed protein product [Rhizoctonia solani]|uniref:Uncharacterized protein n=1 Tax=Rhizoctonia solani TaxID=456999 RepID=A0A8H2X6U8_9AGAM|nr:unnamed protein product [Rhizoctonia solani]
MSVLQSQHPVYGPRLDAYLNSRQVGVGVSRFQTEAPSEMEIRRAIDTLEEPWNVSCATFEAILAMERSPECGFLHLLLESDIEVFPACIQLLRSYCNEGRLFDYAYGYLCLQVISLAVNVAKLALVDELWVVEQGTVQVSQYWGPPVLINDYCRKWEAREFCNDGEYLRPATKLLGWHTDPDNRLETCLPNIEFATLNYETTAVDTADSAQLIAAYLEKMKRLPILKWAYEENLTLIASETLEEAWAEMLKAQGMNLNQWTLFVDTVINNSMTLPMSQHQPLRAPLHLAALTNDNLFELLGRVVLFPLLPDGKFIREDSDRQWEAYAQEMLGLIVKDVNELTG